MTDLLLRRLRNQRLAGSKLSATADAVAWLGAVQAQEYADTRWALGMRTAGTTVTDVEHAFDTGLILRTHVLRPTWHFVAAADIRWLLTLSAPRVHTFNAFPYRTLELDSKTHARSRRVLERALGNHTYLTRTELQAHLRRAGVSADGMRLAYIMMRAELDQVICSGPRRGKQFTYGLLDERAPVRTPFGRDEALAELIGRYFRSHGPATVRDFVWWSGMTVLDAKRGLEILKATLRSQTVGPRTYWSMASEAPTNAKPAHVYLLPSYDEYLIAYKDRELAAGARTAALTSESGTFPNHLVIDGRVAGAWRRTVRSKDVVVETLTNKPLSKAERRAVTEAAERYGKFMNAPVTIARSSSTAATR